MPHTPDQSENFAYALGLTLAAEGVFSDHPADPGGATMYGITERLARRYGYDVRLLTKTDAVAIYRLEFWDKLRLDSVKSKWAAAEMFDTAVNMGHSQAVKCAQRACNLLLPSAAQRLVEDGLMGEKTIAAINAVSALYHRGLLAAMNGYQFMAYVNINNPAFIRGWINKRLSWPSDAPERVR